MRRTSAKLSEAALFVSSMHTQHVSPQPIDTPVSHVKVGIVSKDFRTWAGTVQSALALAQIGPFHSETEAKRNIVAAAKETASRLGNRPATCRNYYVHPAIIESYLDGTLLQTMKPPAAGSSDLLPEEECVLALIRKKAARLTEAA